MDVYLLETKEQCDRLKNISTGKSVLVALTVEAMFWLDKAGARYKTLNDYLSMDYFIELRRESRKPNIAFCQQLDAAIKKKLPGWGQDPSCEPVYWFNKFTYRLIQSAVSYKTLFDAMINKECPKTVIYFQPQRVQKRDLKYAELFFGNDNFLSEFLEEIKKEYPQVNWKSIVIPNNDSLKDPNEKNDLRKWIAARVPWLWQRFVHAALRKDWKYFEREIPETKNLLRLGTNHDIRTLVKNLIQGQSFKEFRQEDLYLEINPAKPIWSKRNFFQRHQKYLEGLSPDTVLFTRQEFIEAVKSCYGTLGDFVIGLLSRKYEIWHAHVLSALLIYKAALELLAAKKILCVVGHSAIDPFHNAIFSAARKNSIRTYIFQHGGDFGESFDYGQTQHTCYSLVDYFGLWGRFTQPYVEKYVQTRCSFFYIGKLNGRIYSPRVFPIQNTPIKNVLFVQNNAFHGYIPLMKDGIWFRFYKEIVKTLKAHPEYQHLFRPCPKGGVEFNPLTEYMKEQLPNLQMASQGTLSEACAKADLVIIDCLSTTLHDALSVNSRVIGLKHPTYVQYYPEVEEKVKKACIFCKSEDEFLRNIGFYLTHPERYPDFGEGIKEWKNFCFDASTEEQFSERFITHLNSSSKSMIKSH